MSALNEKIATSRNEGEASATLGGLALVRACAAGGVTRSEVAADLAGLVGVKLAPAEWRRAIDRELVDLLAARLVTETRGRFSATDQGRAVTARFLSRAIEVFPAWPELRDGVLLAKALGMERDPPARLKLLARPDTLRALLVQKAFDLPLRKNEPPARLRAKLAVAALERAFGNKIKAGLGKGSALSARAGRLLAGQLSANPRDFASDAKLIAALAAETVGAEATDEASLRAAILRRLGAKAIENRQFEAQQASRPERFPPDGRLLCPANDAAPGSRSEPAPHRPDLGEFARIVKVAAAGRAEGWSGSRKAYISHVWQAIRAAEPSWQLSEIEFKCMLAEAHRRGAVMLTNADLKSKANIKELESSAVLYKNAVWHFVRVEE